MLRVIPCATQSNLISLNPCPTLYKTKPGTPTMRHTLFDMEIFIEDLKDWHLSGLVERTLDSGEPDTGESLDPREDDNRAIE